MAEAIGIASGIAGLLSLTITVINISYQYVSSAHGASKSISAYLQELASLKTLLIKLDEIAHSLDTVEIFRECSPALLSMTSIGQCQMVLDQLHSKLRKQNTGNLLLSRLNRLSWPFAEVETRRLIETIHRHRSTFETTLSANGFTVGAMTLREVKGLKQNLREEKDENILNWLSPSNVEEKQKDVFATHQANTGLWLLNSGKFQQWQDGSDLVLWCHGDPGVGKTVMTSIVVNHISSIFSSKNVGIAYLYCDYQDQTDQNPENLTASLVKQLARKQGVMPPRLEELYNKFSRGGKRPDLKELTALLLQLSGSFLQTYIAVDALDECESTVHRKQFLSVLQAMEDAHIKLFITSRSHPPDIRRAFNRKSQLNIVATEQDIREYLASRLDDDYELADLIGPDLRDDILLNITSNVCGMFLLARLHIESIRDSTTIKEIRHALKAMPTKLTDTYDKAIERIQQQPRPHVTLALRVLSWIACARRPLLVEELRHGLAVEFGKSFLDHENLCDARSIVMVCGGLVTIDSESNTIRLAHFTVQEYFRGLPSNLFANAEVEVSRACLTYLLFDAFDTGTCDDDESLDARVQGYPFLSYAAQHWGDHLRGIPEHELKGTAIMFLQDKFKSSCATQVEYRPRLGYPGSSQAYYKGLTALHMAANWGLAWLVECLLLESGVEIDAPDYDGRRPLHKPCREGHETVVRILLENGADMSLQDHYGRTALRWAVDGGKVTIVQLLLKKGADINALVDYHGGTALHWAARTGNEMITETLLNGGANMAARCYDGQAPLQYAIQGGHEAIVQLLLERGANKTKESRSMQTALHRAAQSGEELEVVRLVDEGADVGSLAEGGTTALHLAAFGGHKRIVKFLLEKGADTWAASEDKRTALIRGVEGGHEAVVRLLLEYGADPEARDCYGRMAVHWVARSGCEAVMVLLLDYGASTTAEDTHRRTALQRAAESEQEGMVSLLMSRSVS